MHKSSFIVIAIACLVGALVHLFMPTLLPASVAFVLGAILTIILHIQLQPKATSTTDNNEPLMTLYVGNLPYRVHEGDVKELFSQYGFVSSVRLVRDRKTGRRKGFGFVEMAETGANDALEKLNDYVFQERSIKVREAKTQDDKAQQAEE